MKLILSFLITLSLTGCAAMRRAAEESRINHCMKLRFEGPQPGYGQTDYSYTHDKWECGMR